MNQSGESIEVRSHLNLTLTRARVFKKKNSNARRLGSPIARRLKKKLEDEESHIAALAASPGQPAPTGAVQELDAQRIDSRYTFRIRVLYVLSFVVPFLAMMFFNSGTFRDSW